MCTSVAVLALQLARQSPAARGCGPRHGPLLWTGHELREYNATASRSQELEVHDDGLGRNNMERESLNLNQRPFFLVLMKHSAESLSLNFQS